METKVVRCADKTCKHRLEINLEYKCSLPEIALNGIGGCANWQEAAKVECCPQSHKE